MRYAVPVSYRNIDITGGFWNIRQNRNAKVTIPAVYTRFAETGRMRAMDQAWREGMPDKPHIFWDSDVAKWMEGAAYVMAKTPDEALRRQVEEIIDKIELHQAPDGYFNSYFQSVEPSKRWHDQDWHELYCAGHFMEAAVAWQEATGEDRFLRLMCKYADYIIRVFVEEKSAKFSCPGHEEIELALVKLYHATGETKYLELASHFLEVRGTENGRKQVQDHLPVREQKEAVGHSVRAMYLYAAMADMAMEKDDPTLADACRTLFDNVTNRRMYVTGGVGQTRVGEAFSVDYDLPSDSAYAETCASIGLHLFARRMSLLEPDGKYADIAERTLYNGILSGLSLGGDAFFYENPLEIDLDHRAAMAAVNDPLVLPITQRVELFSCSCCPPNLVRFFASLGDSLCSVLDDTVYVHQYMESTARLTVDGGKAVIRQSTNYPHEGRVVLHTEGMAGKKLALRIPGWAETHILTVDGQPCTAEAQKGYVVIPLERDGEIVLEMPMPLTLLAAPREVHAAAGRVALQRGPLVYCLEGCDNGRHLRDLKLRVGGSASMEFDAAIGAYTITVDGSMSAPAEEGSLYYRFTGREVPKKLKFIPYYAFANRGETDLLVWIRV